MMMVVEEIDKNRAEKNTVHLLQPKIDRGR